MKGTVFIVITFLMYKVIARFSALLLDEAFLIAAVLGILVAYWVPPIPKENRLKCLAIYLLVILGLYFFGFKVPRFLSRFVDYDLAMVVGLAVFGSWVWFFVRPKLKSMP